MACPKPGGSIRPALDIPEDRIPAKISFFYMAITEPCCTNRWCRRETALTDPTPSCPSQSCALMPVPELRPYARPRAVPLCPSQSCALVPVPELCPCARPRAAGRTLGPRHWPTALAHSIGPRHWLTNMPRHRRPHTLGQGDTPETIMYGHAYRHA